MSRLYVVATPIGNLGDITLRALNTLREVDLILCEDTRRTRKLLSHFEIKKPLLSYHDFNEEKRTPEVLEKLKDGQSIALVTDAGTPLISDPGFALVRECIRQKVDVIPIPGPSAVMAALSVSGLPVNKFIFLGFLPKSRTKREETLKNLYQCFKSLKQNYSLVFFESPKRLLESLELVRAVFGNARVAVCFELTKIHEKTYRGGVAEVIKMLKGEVKEEKLPKGEVTVVISVHH
jgi:16S rRNA (cytidine1402-2'-O)-methyltransferase